SNPFDLFETFFGTSMGGFAGGDATGFGGRRVTIVIKGKDIQYDMRLEFSAAIFGTKKEFELSHLEAMGGSSIVRVVVGVNISIPVACLHDRKVPSTIANFLMPTSNDPHSSMKKL
ncbi:hypothetical protein M8C21_016075, partial [Ambrosia artemisiifolia]